MKHSKVLVSAVALAIGAAALAKADNHPWNDEVGQWFVAPFAGMTFVDDDRLLEDGLHWGASIGKHLSDDWSAQLTGYTGDFDNDGKKPEWTWPASFDGSISGASLDLMRVFARDGRFSPYILGGSATSRRITKARNVTTTSPRRSASAPCGTSRAAPMVRARCSCAPKCARATTCRPATR